MNGSASEGFASGSDVARSCVERNRSLKGLAVGGGYFDIEIHRADGTVEKLAPAKNQMTNVAADDVNNIYLRNGTPKTAWYAGLVSNVAFTSFGVADTMASHGTWVETSAYSESVRQTWAPAASSGQTITTGTQMSFTVNAAATAIRGLFITSDSTKGGTAGLLFATAPFAEGVQTLGVGDVLKATYAFTLTPG